MILVYVLPLFQDAWYKFDDDDVSPFNSQEIETSCFGGMALSTSVR